MQTIINTTDQYSAKDNLIFLATDTKQLKDKNLSAEEISYVKLHHREHKKNVFAFNRISRWIFVVLFEKEKDNSLRLENYRVAGAKLLGTINDNKLHRVVVIDVENKLQECLAFAEGMALANYQFLKYKKDPSEKLNSLNSIDICSTGIRDSEVDVLNIKTDATCRCRDLVNEPVATLNARKLALEIEAMGKSVGAKVEIFDKKKIEVLKMGGLLAVNKGSVDPPSFTIMEWKPKKADQ